LGAQAQSLYSFQHSILSSLRHVVASRPHIVKIFEKQTRELFIRENAPSPEPRPEYFGAETTASGQPVAEPDVDAQLADSGYDTRDVEWDGMEVDEPDQRNTRSDYYIHPLIAPSAAEPDMPIAPQHVNSDAELLPEALVHTIEQTPIAELDFDKERNDKFIPVSPPIAIRRKVYAYTLAQPYPDTEREPQPPCEKPSANAKGKQRAIEPESEPESELEEFADSGLTQNHAEWVVSISIFSFVDDIFMTIFTCSSLNSL
jgi:hypothetical protein